MAQPGHGAVVRRRLPLGAERTCRLSGPTTDFDPQWTLDSKQVPFSLSQADFTAKMPFVIQGGRHEAP